MLILLLINLLRITPLTYDIDLSHRADIRAMVVYSDWSHNNWKTSFKDSGCDYIGENLSKNFKSSKKELKSFMKSSTHKENILNEHYQRIGIGGYKKVSVYLFCGNI